METPAAKSENREAKLSQGALILGLDLQDRQTSQLVDFLSLLQKWNKVYNLTSVRDLKSMLNLHLLDSLAAVMPLHRQLSHTHPQHELRLLDVGSGGGLPGVVFAICCPEVVIDCVDTVGKKAAFVQHAAASLGLKNLRGLHNRVENLRDSYTVVSSRAFASLAHFTSLSKEALAEHGVWMAMKGKHPEDELVALPSWVNVFHVEQITVPGLDAERCIVWMRKASDSTSGLKAVQVT